MRLKNYQEDLVLSCINLVLEDAHPKLLNEQNVINDIAAFVLNRIAPNYLLSHRGLNRLALQRFEVENDNKPTVDMISIIILVNQAINLIENRRVSPYLKNPEPPPSINDDLFPVHNLPHIVGKLVNQQDKQPVSGAKVTLYRNGEMPPPAAPGWPNPCYTYVQTKGYFCFWPRYVRDNGESMEHTIGIKVNHPGFQDYSMVKQVRSNCDYKIAEVINPKEMILLDPIELVPISQPETPNPTSA